MMMHWNIVLALCLCTFARSGLSILPTRVDSSIGISPASTAAKGQQLEDEDPYKGRNVNGSLFAFHRCKDEATEMETFNMDPATETNFQNPERLSKFPTGITYMKQTERRKARADSNSSSLESSTENEVNWGAFITALPTLLPCQITAQVLSNRFKCPPPPNLVLKERSINAGGHLDDNEISNFSDVYPRHLDNATDSSSSAAMEIPASYEQDNSIAEYSAVQYQDDKPPPFQSQQKGHAPETDDEQYDYILSYDDLFHAVKNMKDPYGRRKESLKTPARNLLVAIFSGGEGKEDHPSTSGHTTERNTEPPDRFSDMPPSPCSIELPTIRTNHSNATLAPYPSMMYQMNNYADRQKCRFSPVVPTLNRAQTRHRTFTTDSEPSKTKLKVGPKTQKTKYFPPEYKTKVIPTARYLIPHLILAPRP